MRNEGISVFCVRNIQCTIIIKRNNILCMRLCCLGDVYLFIIILVYNFCIIFSIYKKNILYRDCFLMLRTFHIALFCNTYKNEAFFFFILFFINFFQTITFFISKAANEQTVYPMEGSHRHP